MRDTSLGAVPRGVLGAALGLGFVLAGAAGAFACTPTAHLILKPDRAEAGQVVPVEGADFVPGATVDVRFDGVNGFLAWSGHADPKGAFLFSFAVPNAVPGDHYLAAYDRASTHAGSTGTGAMEVLAPASVGGPAPLPPGDGHPAPAPAAPLTTATATPTPAPGGPARNGTPQPAPSAAQRSPRPAESRPIATGALPVPPVTRAVDRPPAGAAASGSEPDGAEARYPLPPVSKLEFDTASTSSGLISPSTPTRPGSVDRLVLRGALPLAGGLVALGVAAALVSVRKRALLRVPSARTGRR